MKNYLITELPMKLQIALIDWYKLDPFNIRRQNKSWIEILRENNLMTAELEIELAALILSGKKNDEG